MGELVICLSDLAPWIDDLCDRLRNAGFDAPARPELRAWKLAKRITNLGPGGRSPPRVRSTTTRRERSGGGFETSAEMMQLSGGSRSTPAPRQPAPPPARARTRAVKSFG